MRIGKRPCAICRRWFQPHPRLGSRQRVCAEADCQAERQRRSAASWAALHPDYAVRWQMKQRARQAKQSEPVDPLPVPSPLDRLPWDLAQETFGVQGADFLCHLGRLRVGGPKESMRG